MAPPPGGALSHFWGRPPLVVSDGVPVRLRVGSQGYGGVRRRCAGPRPESLIGLRGTVAVAADFGDRAAGAPVWT
ncbi:MAG: hypothetical protein ACRDJ9_29895, partial [Dehalococcoidia bacterium]